MKLLSIANARLSAAVLLCALVSAAWAVPTLPDGPECEADGTGGPLHITADCVDPEYNFPFITSETDETTPVPHRRVSGIFNGTEVDFNIYLPPADQWAGRFFQLVYPTQNSTAEDEAIAFSVDSGAHTVRVTGTLGYRADAAAAKFAREVAREYYEDPERQIYGYVYGGSGGSFMTVGAMEHTSGVWDGSVTLIQAVPVSNPNNWSIRALAGLLLEGKAQQVVDAMRPGGSKNPFANLTEAERATLEEATALGVPLDAWEDFEGVGGNRVHLLDLLWTMVVEPVRESDPTYADDFWNELGYIGTEESELGEFFRAALVEYDATVTNIQASKDDLPVVELDSIPANPPARGLEFTLVDALGEQASFTGHLDADSKTVTPDANADPEVLATLREGTKLRVDNRWYLAVHGFHRHQVPTRPGFYGYDYLRDDVGSPIYPQRDVLLAPDIAESTTGGSKHSGNITGKMIVMDNLRDFDAFPWHATWYQSQVQEALGDRFGDNYRLIFNENADHNMGAVPKELQTRLVDFTGLYEQLLRDLSSWVEEGTEPPEGTAYTVENGQVRVPATASERKGIQPVVELTIDGGNRTEITTGESVTFELRAEAPPGTGLIVSVEWDFYGTGDFVEVEFGGVGERVETSASHAYSEAGVYFPAVRVASHREGDADTEFARALNLGRARVVVT